MIRNVIIIAVVAVSVIAATRFFRSADEEETQQMYQLLTVETRDIIVAASAAGTVEPIRTVEVKSKASGEIFELHVETGDVVRAGQLLVRVDPRIPQATLRQAQADLELAEAQLENAQAQLRRAEGLFETQSITEEEYDNTRLSVASANAQLVRAQRSLSDAEIAAEDTDVRAPGVGVIIQKNVEVGTVISSATREVGGGTILLQMANLDTVQVRSLVDETDIGKISEGLEVTILVDAYPNRPFDGNVLRIEPQATVAQNVTMFPVLIRIPNSDGLLRPGMNAEVEMHVGSKYGAVAVPNAALRTDGADVTSAAEVLGFDPEQVAQQIADQRAGGGEQTTPSESTAEDRTITLMGDRRVTVPEDVSMEDARALESKLQGASGMQAFQSLSESERTLLRQLMGSMGGMRGGGGDHAGGRRSNTSSTDAALMGGTYTVFALRGGFAEPVSVRTGLTDLDYSEVISGLSVGDTVLVLPSSSLLASQQQMQAMMSRMRGGMPGISRR
jgi:HlyD family secretion protein